MLEEKSSTEKVRSDNVEHITSAISNPYLTWTEAEEKKIRNKIDWRIVPIVTVLYLMCFLDRANIGNARIQGMEQDLHLEGYDFNWVLTSFYISYLLIEIPSNVVLKWIGAKIWIPFLVFGFGLISICTAFVQNKQGLIASRIFLGIAEGGTMPGIAFYLSCFYKREELLFRVGIFVSAASMAGAFGGLLAAGFTNVPRWGTESVPIHTWRNIFFFEGIITCLLAAIAPFIMPKSAAHSNFLTPHERAIANERLIREHKADPFEGTVKPHHAKAGLLNFFNFFCGIGFFLVNITVQGLSLFMPTILQDLGYTSIRAQLYSVPPYVTASVCNIAIAFISDKTRMRGLYLGLFSCLSVSGFAILRTVDSAHAKYGAIFMAAIGAFPGGPGFLTWAMNNSAGPPVRAVTGAYVVSVGTMGAIVAVWAYLKKDAPLYHVGHSINLGAQAAVIVLAIVLVLYCLRENKKRARGERDHRIQGLTEEEAHDLGFRHPEFRYMP